MDLKEQKYVCTLAECKSLTRASERLYISQPALSLYINNVEKILGARLFERNGRKFELTWLGKQYVEKASQMLELERQFEAVRRQTERENAGQVRIGIAQRRGIWFLPAVLSVYERELFYRKYYYCQSTAQIAAELGITERAAEGRLYRLRQRLRNLLGGDLL